MMWDGMGFHGAGGLPMLLFWILLIVVIALLVKWLIGRTSVTTTPEKTPLQILQERYARGEVDREEYLQRKADLEK